MTMKDFYIPIDEHIKTFEKHLYANPRTILSSKFGDGKSYFLQKVKESPELTEKYAFLTIYPVNYQVADNKDIFEIVKRDILFQLMLNGMISDRVTLTKQEALPWFLLNKHKSIIANLLPFVSEVGLTALQFSKLIPLMTGGIKVFDSLKQEFKKFYENEVPNDDMHIETFLDKLDKNEIYECDIITRIIQKTIKDYKSQNHKEVVLIIEDMDRLDPAHLFRILNVLSAQIDYGYKYGIKLDATLAGNKFDLDHVVLVIDYNNLKHIYQHFYGPNTDFDGYISKFLSSVPFYYSIKEIRHQFISNRISELSDIPEEVISKLLPPELVQENTIRNIVQSFEITKDIKQVPEVIFQGKNIQLDISALKLMAILKRLGLDKSEITDKIYSIHQIDQRLFTSIVCPYMYLDPESLKIAIADEDGNWYNDHLIGTIPIFDHDWIFDKETFSEKLLLLDPETGQARMTRAGIDILVNPKETDYTSCIENMFNYIA